MRAAFLAGRGEPIPVYIILAKFAALKGAALGFREHFKAAQPTPANPCVPILHLLRLRQKNKSCFLPQTCAAEHLGSLAWAQIASSRVSPWGDKQSLQHSFCNVAKIKRRWLSLRAVCQLI